MKKQRYSTRFLCRTAVLSALVCVMTMVPRIPIPLGYAHLGNAMILLAVFFAGWREGIWAAGIGSALADILGGFAVWALPTLVIKIIMAWIMGSMGTEKLSSARTMSAVVLSMVWMVIGYTLAGAVLYGGLAVGLSSTPGLAVEGAVNAAAGCAAAIALEQAGLRQRLRAK